MTQNQISVQFDYSAIDNSQLADSTKYKYQREIEKYLDTGHKLSDTAALEEYARTLNSSSRSFLKAAIRIISQGYERKLKSSATPDNIQEVQAGLLRLEAIQDTIKVKTHNGEKVHTWLSNAQVRKLILTCGADLPGTRDWIVLALLVGAGLRRDELVNLEFDAIKEVPINGNGNGSTRFVLEVKGKGEKDRPIPINRTLAERLLDWHTVVGDGLIARSLGMKQVIGDSLSAVAVFHIVRKHGAMIGIDKLDPHDLRRTYAQLGYDAGVPITQISRLLGHSNVGVTQKYLNLELDYENTISDFIPLE
jgi:site-specific recombinase XerC